MIDLATIEELVKGFYSAMNEYDFESIKNYLAEDFKMVTVIDRETDKQGFMDMLFLGQKAFPDRKVTIERIMTKDNAAMVEFAYAATHTGDYLGFPATNNRIELSAVDILEFESGRIKYLKDIFNWSIFERGINPH